MRTGSSGAVSRRRRGEGGFTLMEVVVAGGLGVLAAGLGAFLFLGQLKGYRDMDMQAKLNTDSKRSVQVMLREISNTGAVLANPRQDFVMQSGRIQLAYMDLRGRYCRTDQRVTASFYVAPARDPVKGDTLIHQHRCEGGAWVRDPLVVGVGRVYLGFTYYNAAGAATAVPAEVKVVQFVIRMLSPQGKSLFERSRLPHGRVELVN